MAVEVRELTKTFQSAHGAVSALREVDFSVAAGQALGIIGRNGAGKSTLLQIVAGVLAPTSGTVLRPKRIASLLELGSGFHPDLTGEENLMMGVALASQTDHAISRRASEIIEFSGLGASALRQPVKQYSDGMKARLACSIAVHGDVDLLIVDEALAVGDAAFQREVLTRIRGLRDGGTTLLLVTHSVDLARSACERVLWLEHGAVLRDGDAATVLDEYEATAARGRRYRRDPSVRIDALRVEPRVLQPGDGFRMTAQFEVNAPCENIQWRVDLRPVAGDEPWMRSQDELPEHRDVNLVASTMRHDLGALDPGRHSLRIDVPVVPITDSELEATLMLLDAAGSIHDELMETIRIGSALKRPTYRMTATSVSSEDSRPDLSHDPQ
jgi:ABC-type polysaccharide/polyol phosphate transport system ATPase subunit